MKLKKQHCYDFISKKIDENREAMRKELKIADETKFEERYSSIDFDSYGKKLTDLATKTNKLWEEFSKEVLAKPDTDVESPGWSHFIKSSQSILSLSENIDWFKRKVVDDSTATEKAFDEIKEKYNSVETELKKILRNLKSLPNGKKCKEYLEELGYILPEDFTEVKHEVFAPINKKLLGLPESK